MWSWVKKGGRPGHNLLQKQAQLWDGAFSNPNIFYATLKHGQGERGTIQKLLLLLPRNHTMAPYCALSAASIPSFHRWSRAATY